MRRLPSCGRSCGKQRRGRTSDAGMGNIILPSDPGGDGPAGRAGTADQSRPPLRPVGVGAGPPAGAGTAVHIPGGGAHGGSAAGGAERGDPLCPARPVRPGGGGPQCDGRGGGGPHGRKFLRLRPPGGRGTDRPPLCRPYQPPGGPGVGVAHGGRRRGYGAPGLQPSFLRAAPAGAQAPCRGGRTHSGVPGGGTAVSLPVWTFSSCHLRNRTGGRPHKIPPCAHPRADPLPASGPPVERPAGRGPGGPLVEPAGVACGGLQPPGRGAGL